MASPSTTMTGSAVTRVLPFGSRHSVHILERNRFIHGPNTNTDILLVGRRIKTSGNTRADGGSVTISTDASATYTSLPSTWRGPYYIQ